jgi:hypothetical protein
METTRSRFPVALREKPSDINGDPLDRSSDVVLVHRVQSSGSGASVRRTVVSPFTHPLFVTLQLLPIVSLPDFLDGLFLAPSFPRSYQTGNTASISFTLLGEMTI